MRLLICLAIGGAALFYVAGVGPVAWQDYEGATSPEVAAIRSHPVHSTAFVVEPLIDGVGGDPALAYRYTVSGRTYDGFDIGNAKTGDVLARKPGEQVPIVYAANMPSVSCLDGSTDCPNDVFDPAILAFGFWAIIFCGTVGGGATLALVFAARSLRRRLTRAHSRD